MDDIAETLVALLVLVLVLVFVNMVEQQAYKAEMTVAKTGTIMKGMKQDHVLAAFGPPDSVSTSGWGPFEKTTWVYRNPFRAVTFNERGEVTDWSPKGHW
jgi:hypothetical protein